MPHHARSRRRSTLVTAALAPVAALVGLFAVPASGQAAPSGSPYAALGDSYSSGEGNPPYLPLTDTHDDQCHRSVDAYPVVLGRQGVFSRQPFNPDTDFVACSGADTVSLRLGRSHEAGQFRALGPATTTVTLSVGGNDLGFSDLAQACFHVGPSGNPNCKNGKVDNPAGGGKITRAEREIWLTEHLYLHTLYQEIHTRAPQARIYVLLYPHLIAMRGRACSTGPGSYSARNIIWFHDMVDYLDQHITAEAAIARDAGADIRVADPRPAFDNGHTLCSTASWIHGVSFRTDDCTWASRGSACFAATFHPTSEGQQAFADAIRQASSAS
ncbi:SGNH/GDSL hydrolase family protein [Streptomyces sp. NPDC102394]|uniref:SGNH/GDSL hydrolase family protein n=1 Tax=Streptomyces sp. NPDC102394 TaxID=3366167 RepID=UPI003818BE6A